MKNFNDVKKSLLRNNRLNSEIKHKNEGIRADEEGLKRWRIHKLR